MIAKIIKISLLGFIISCQFQCNNPSVLTKKEDINLSVFTLPSKSDYQQDIHSEGNTIVQRFTPPKGYQRTPASSSSFATFLRNLPLKDKEAKVRYYNGSIKPNTGGYAAVIDLPIGTRDLHQCADAVMRLRADYLFQQKRYEDIHFNFTNGFQADYATWRTGNRIRVSGNQVTWKKVVTPSDTKEAYWKYLEMVFSYAGTYSLSRELKPVPINEMQIGDVFIQGGFPGHAVIVVDMVENKSTDKKLFLLAQSYMPAQELHVLSNLNNKDISPWYSLGFVEELNTPDWGFTNRDLKRF